MARTPEQKLLAEAHRDADGNGLLASPNCPDCGRRATVRYRCTECGRVWGVPGEYRWYWQGLGHWHVAGDEAAFLADVAEHLRYEHGGQGVIVPDPTEEDNHD